MIYKKNLIELYAQNAKKKNPISNSRIITLSVLVWPLGVW